MGGAQLTGGGEAAEAAAEDQDVGHGPSRVGDRRAGRAYGLDDARSRPPVAGSWAGLRGVTTR